MMVFLRQHFLFNLQTHSTYVIDMIDNTIILKINIYTF